MSRNPVYTISRIILFSISIVFFSMLGVFIDFFMGGGSADAAPAITIRVNTTADNNLSDGIHFLTRSDSSGQWGHRGRWPTDRPGTGSQPY